GGEPAADRLVQGPRRLQQDLGALRARRRRGGRRGERRQPRPGGGVGGTGGRRAGDGLRSPGRADGQGRGGPELRRPGRDDGRTDVRVVGVQAAGCLPGGSGFTIADGIAVKEPGELTMGILDQALDALVSVSDEEISRAIVLLLERAKLVVEGAGAVGVAALLAGKVPGDGPVAIVLSGGNIDATLLISVMRHGLTHAGRYVVLRTRVPDRPGELARLLELLADQRVNVVSVEHHREGMAMSVAETEVELTLTTRDAEHCADVLAALEDLGYPVERLR